MQATHRSEVVPLRRKIVRRADGPAARSGDVGEKGTTFNDAPLATGKRIRGSSLEKGLASLETGWRPVNLLLGHPVTGKFNTITPPRNSPKRGQRQSAATYANQRSASIVLCSQPTARGSLAFRLGTPPARKSAYRQYQSLWPTRFRTERQPKLRYALRLHLPPENGGRPGLEAPIMKDFRGEWGSRIASLSRSLAAQTRPDDHWEVDWRQSV